jgi:hypothetical protein
MNILALPTPAESIKKRKTPSGVELSYVSHSYITQKLNQVLGLHWSFEIASHEIVDHHDQNLPSEVVVLGRLRIVINNTTSTVITKEQFGSQAIKSDMSIGDTFKSAASDALRKCASLLGIALDLYDAPRTESESLENLQSMVEQVTGQEVKVKIHEHWSDGPDGTKLEDWRKRQYTAKGQELTKERMLDALKVSELALYQGTVKEARDALLAWMKKN